MTIRTSLSNYRTHTQRPPRVTSVRRQPTTKAPRNVRPPSMAQVFAPSWGRPALAPAWGRPGPGFGSPQAPSAPAAPQAPVGGAPAVPAGLPVDPAYDQAIASLTRRRDDSLSSLAQQRFGGLTDYGYNEAPTGGVTLDPSNPYSRASLLQRSHDQHRAGNTTSMANAGQLYSGALVNAQNATDQGFQQGSDSLQKAMLGFLARNTQQKAQAQTGFEEGAGQAYSDRVQRAADNPLYDPEALAALAAAQPAPVAPAPAPAAAAPKPKPKPKPAPRVTSTSRQPTTRAGTRAPRPALPVRGPKTRKPKARTRH